MPKIEAQAVIVLTGETSHVIPVISTAVNITTNLKPEPSSLLNENVQAHFLTFDELIDEELIHNEIVSKDE